MNRTAQDLINDLKAEELAFKLAGKGTVLDVRLAVGFENGTEFIQHDDPAALWKLNGCIQRGGAPVGFISIIRDTPKTISVRASPLDEYAGDERITQFLQNLQKDVAEGYA